MLIAIKSEVKEVPEMVEEQEIEEKELESDSDIEEVSLDEAEKIDHPEG